MTQELLKDLAHLKAIAEENYTRIPISVLRYIAELEEKITRAYTEEDMIKFAEFVSKYPDKNINLHGEMLHAKSKYDEAERTIDLLKLYKTNRND